MSKPTIARRAARPFVIFVERYYPDPFVFVILLTVLTFVLALTLTDVGAAGSLQAWGDGLPGLLRFMSQIAITLISAHALAHTDAVDRIVGRLSRIPGSVTQCYVTVILVASLASLIAWSLGLIVGALVARRVAQEGARRHLDLHYPLVVACAYSGFVVWHMGYSGSAPLFVATPQHEFEAMIGIIPITDTVFTLRNLVAILTTIAVVVLICPRMHPATRDVVRVDFDPDDEADNVAGDGAEHQDHPVDRMRAVSLGFGALLMAYLVSWFWRQGFALTLDIVNWSFVALGLMLARSPVHYVRLVGDAGRNAGAILIQYPFYAGIMGLMVGSDLVGVIANWFTQFATAETLPFFAFLSGGLINMFVPSGGGQWAIQGPIFLDAAQSLGTDPARIVMGVAYGDQWTNLVQPFWTIPLLAIAGLHMRSILGFCFVIFLATGVTLGLSTLL